MRPLHEERNDCFESLRYILKVVGNTILLTCVVP